MSNNPYGLAALWSGGDALLRTVAVLLLLMSVVSWYVIITRTWRVLRLRRAARAAADAGPVSGSARRVPRRLTCVRPRQSTDRTPRGCRVRGSCAPTR